MKKIILLIVVLFAFVNTHATHIMGGEITWECIKDPNNPDVGKYIFRMKVYRDCDGTTLSTFSQTIDVWDGGVNPISNISLDYVSSTDISPPGDAVNSGNACLDCNTNPVGAVEEYLYESQPIALPGTPPATGWFFTWDSCCRNGAISNLVILTPANPSEGFTLRASMFPFTDANGNILPADPCYDNSPKFNESPKTIICIGYSFSYTPNASDFELDSLSYSWDEPLDDIGFGTAYNPGLNPLSIPFVAPYTFNNPLPGGVTLNAQTGEINYASNIAGNFSSVIRVDAFKCGQKVASIYREIQSVLIACPILPNGTINLPPILNTSPPSVFFQSVSAGDLVTFNITASDNDLYANGLSQDITLEISGGQVSDDYITNTLCDNPPCATFVNTSGLAPPITGLQLVEGVFEWQTACSHVATDAGCGITSNIYTFAIKAFDDFCPANAITIATITIEVSAADSLPAPDFECAWESPNGDVTFNWNSSVGASSSTVYHIYGSENIGGPYTILSDVSYPYESDVVPASSLVGGIKYFYLTSESTCAENSLSSDTISPIYFSISNTNINCWDDTDGSVQVSVEDYTNVLLYDFYLDGVLNTSAHPLDTFFSNVSAGSHIITVVDNSSGCLLEVPVTISAPGFPLQALASSEVAVCYGGSSGFVVGSSAGGTPGYIYSWYESGNPVSFSDNDTAIGLIAGSYYLSVEDANGCDTFTSVNIIEPQVALQASAQIFGIPCKGDNTGMLVGDAGGGWGPYAYYWLDSQGDTVQSSSSYIFQRDTLFDLFAGIYVLHIYDVRGCFVDYTFNVPEPSNALSIDSLVLVEGIACYSDSVGKAILYATGGQVNYAYLWDNGETSSIADGLTSGYHSVTLSDDWGCEVVDSIYISENPLIESDLTNIQNVSCYGDADGIATISSVGGFSSVYTYFWSQGQQTVGVNLDIAVGLLQGSYFVTTRDILGCEVVDSIYISEPEPLSMEAFELDQIDCYGANDGLAAATAVGGTLPYVFDWDNGQWVGDTINTLTPGLHIVVVTDAKGCSASDTVFTHEPTELMIEIDDTQTILPYCVGVNTASLSAFAYGGTPGYTYVWDDNLNLPQTTTTASALLADNYNSSDSSYTITVTDTKGCIASASTDTLRVYLESMDASVASLHQYSSGGLDSNEVSCFGYNDGGAQVTASGGHAPYAYQWFGGSSATTATINNLYSGVYSVTIRDTNNCMVNRSIVLSEPSSLTFNISVSTSESCLGACDGTILIDSLSGGVALYTALLTDNQTGFITSHSITANNYISNVCSGDYTVALTDINNCPSSVIAGGVNQQVVDYDTYTVASISILTDTICNASSTGVLTILNPNLNPGYSYSWENINNSGVVIGSGVQVDSLVAGIYVLLANYNNTLGCSVSDTLEVVEYSAITNTVTIEHVDCFGESTGSILASSSGTIPPYSYTWNSGQTSALASNLTVGVDTLTVTDGNGCEREFTYSVTEPEALSVNITESSYVLTSGIPLGGTAPFSYSWREQSNPFVSIGTSVTYIVANYGVYYVVVTDGNGCTVESNIFDNISTGAGQLSSGIALSIYPNPFREETTVDFGKQVKQASIKLVDVFGKLIEEYNVIDTDKHILKRENKASGIYFIEIEVEGIKLFYKIIIE